MTKQKLEKKKLQQHKENIIQSTKTNIKNGIKWYNTLFIL